VSDTEALFKTWNDVATGTYIKPPFLIEEFIPSEGIVLLWGVSSIGKTPIAWHMARSLATGADFAGFLVRKSKVLFIELDQPEIVTAERIRDLPLLPDDSLLVLEHLAPFTTPLEPKCQERLEFLNASVEPDVVFIDTLRKCHNLDDIPSETVQKVYTQFRRIFPTSCVVFIHHERKMGIDDHRPPEESFAGNRAWINDAQIGIRAHKHKGDLVLTMLKNQMGEIDWNVRFKLVNGNELRSNVNEKQLLREIVETVEPKERVAAAIKMFGMPERTARRKVRMAEEDAARI